MKKINKSFLVFSLVGLVLTLSACGTEPNVNDNMDIQDQNAVSETASTRQINNNVETDKKIEAGDFVAEAAPANTEKTMTEKDVQEEAVAQVVSPDKQVNLLAKYSGAIIKTNLGNVQVKFYNEDSPITVNNFLNLAQAGFYNNTKFHRVIKDFMIQGGDPNSKDDDWSNDGIGGPGYYFADEFNSHKLVAGSLAMANRGAGTSSNGSQFFIVTAASTPWLDGAHTNFGQVISGMDIVNQIGLVAVNGNDHPLDDVTVESIELLK
ncbi:MAG: peptidylprolyl isomerase [Patescibacteria group bacterium]|nr:peptidylprolyl isomerase [Patescibacteria group bacterium]